MHLTFWETFITSFTSTLVSHRSTYLCNIELSSSAFSPPVRSTLLPLRPSHPNASNQLRCPSLAFHPFIYVLIEIRQLALAAVFKVRMYHWFIERRNNITASHSPSPAHSHVSCRGFDRHWAWSRCLHQAVLMTLAVDLSFFFPFFFF